MDDGVEPVSGLMETVPMNVIDRLTRGTKLRTGRSRSRRMLSVVMDYFDTQSNRIAKRRSWSKKFSNSPGCTKSVVNEETVFRDTGSTE